jgi:hypothetical protein
MAEFRFTRTSREPSAGEESAGDELAVAPIRPQASQLRRERRQLAEKREIEIRDLGGLLLEMVRRERFKEELLLERAQDVLAIEQRIREIDAILAPTQGLVTEDGLPACVCGTPIQPRARFCWRCGRPAAGAMPLVACRQCRHPLQADAEYCPRCGNPTARYGSTEQTLVAPPDAS